GVTPNGNGPAPHRWLIDATAPVVARFTRPEPSVSRHVSGVIDRSWPAAKSLTHLRTVTPWAFATLPTPLLKVVMQAWSVVETCARTGAVSPQRDPRAMRATT